MNLPIEVAALAFSMSLFSALPLKSARVRRHSDRLFLLGTGAMMGICFFDLLPDVLELGGSRALWVSMGVLGTYSAVHSLRFFRHEHDPSQGNHAFLLFFAPLLAHGFASGMLLGVARAFSGRIEESVFAALFAHKAYESLLLGSILLSQRKPARWNAWVIAFYAAALPAGAAVAALLRPGITREAAVLISAVATGTLLGCLAFDFLIPSFGRLRGRSSELVWIVGGLLLTRLVI